MNRHYFSELLKDRGNPFEIETELRIRKLFENKTGHEFEFRKNDDPFAWDIECFKYIQRGSEWERVFCCFVEVEVSEQWQNEYPAYWKTYSFLARKIHPFVNGRFLTDQLREHAEKCFYIVCNKSITDCKMICLSDAMSGSFKQCGSLSSLGSYGSAFRRFPLNSELVYRGFENSVSAVLQFSNNV